MSKILFTSKTVFQISPGHIPNSTPQNPSGTLAQESLQTTPEPSQAHFRALILLSARDTDTPNTTLQTRLRNRRTAPRHCRRPEAHTSRLPFQVWLAKRGKKGEPSPHTGLPICPLKTTFTKGNSCKMGQKVMFNTTNKGNIRSAGKILWDAVDACEMRFSHHRSETMVSADCKYQQLVCRKSLQIRSC